METYTVSSFPSQNVIHKPLHKYDGLLKKQFPETAQGASYEVLTGEIVLVPYTTAGYSTMNIYALHKSFNRANPTTNHDDIVIAMSKSQIVFARLQSIVHYENVLALCREVTDTLELWFKDQEEPVKELYLLSHKSDNGTVAGDACYVHATYKPLPKEGVDRAHEYMPDEEVQRAYRTRFKIVYESMHQASRKLGARFLYAAYWNPAFEQLPAECCIRVGDFGHEALGGGEARPYVRIEDSKGKRLIRPNLPW